MQRKKILLISAGIGAVAGALGALSRIQIPASAFDRALVGQRPFLIACVAGWLLFSLYWEVAARSAASSTSSESSASRRIHVVLTNVALLLEIAPVAGLGRFVPVVPLVMAAGLAIEALGLLVAIWARRHLGRYWSGEITIKTDHRLICSGPYRTLRHPIYTGLLLMYAGTAVVTGEWLAIVGLALAVLAYLRKIRLEEANLHAAFGADYAAYCRDRRMLVPGVL